MIDLINCKECAERRAKIVEHMKAMAEWVKNPAGSPNPFSSKLPAAPQIIARPNNAKTDKSP
jgi:hypothetical protein